jgi:hypothetical protein
MGWRTETLAGTRMKTITLTTHGEELLQQELARRPDESPEQVVERALEVLLEMETQNSRLGVQECQEAASMIRQLRKGITLGGLKIKNLIREGRKY